ncbi:MAG TPA: pantoate--beta-alanine ligase [Spirochaetia bacterium]|nr:MAG: pantoate--beta-alanine ligase [Spirochaetes bacterium GWB1_36_13]HCL56371.1 pantoate--beta-alanine ligase [Spirochaetia bacterium]
MKIIRDEKELQNEIFKLKAQGKKIGLVPTMGALHEGHLSLVKKAREENDVAAASIFVNPIQFGPNEDLAKYPRTFEADCEKLEKEKTDILFFPEASSIYPEGYGTYINVENNFTDKLCGAKRPGHFKGVSTVVGMLFHLFQPDRAYFGLKDYQQVLVIKKMVKDLRFPVEVVPMPIIREEDGLAMSSRNKYLSPEDRLEALCLSRALKLAGDRVKNGERDRKTIYQLIEKEILKSKNAKIDYISIADAQTLEEREIIDPSSTLIALAVFIKQVRLIDNLLVKTVVS